MTTTSECVEMYRLFTNSGLTPDEAAELVDGIARLSRQQKEVLSQKLDRNQKDWKASTLVSDKEGNAILDELSDGNHVLAAEPVR